MSTPGQAGMILSENEMNNTLYSLIKTKLL